MSDETEAERPDGERGRRPGAYEPMNEIGSFLDRCLNGHDEGDERKTGFALMAFPFGCDPAGGCYIVSNANREHVILMMKETLLRLEGERRGRA